MKIKLNFAFYTLKRRHIILITRTFVFLCFATTFGLVPNVNTSFENIDNNLQQQITGTVTDINGQPLAGATVLEKGTLNGAQTDFDGKYAITLSNQNATLVVSYIGFTTKEVIINNQTSINIVLEEDISQLDEVVVVGYGTQKKVNLTAAVSVIGSETFENRPVANATRALQGAAPGLVITNSVSGGQPGAEPNINIRGFITSDADGFNSNAQPLILIDGIIMGLSNINPEDIESVSVLKDAAAASIYGSRAAGGAIIITTKSGKNMNGKVRVSYSNNFSFTQPTIWPESVDALNFAYAVNDARINNRNGVYWNEERLGWIADNVANPGSAPTLVPNNSGLAWDQTAVGLRATANTDWKDFLFKDFAERRKHDLSISGGDQKLNYYLSAGIYEEDGLLTQGFEDFQRYNIDAKIASKPKDWLTLELLTKVVKSKSDYPSDVGRGSTARNTSIIFDLLSKIKPTLPIVDPNGEPLIQAYYPRWKNERYQTEVNQIVLSPRMIIEPVKDLMVNLQLNYRRNNNMQAFKLLTTSFLRPDGVTEVFARTQENTVYQPTVSNNEYFSPNLFATYDKSIGDHNFNATVGYQSETNDFYQLGANTTYLITDNIVSLNSSLDDDQLVNEAITHWSTQSVFSRFRYNYKEKYLLEFSYRRDGSSRFAADNRWAGFPSYSAAYNVAKENFWPIKKISTLKLRGSYGTLGNQNVGLYNYIPTIDVGNTSFLFDGSQSLQAPTPGLASENLTWERVKTLDFGIDINAFNNKLGIVFDWYRTDIEGMAAQGVDLPAVLGTTAPQTNIGTSRIQGWEFEATWRQSLSDNFSYNIRAVLSDYQRTIVEYPNEANSYALGFWDGRDLGDIYGLVWDGWFQTDDEYQTYGIDQSFVAGNFWAGDTKYADLDGNGVIDRGNYVEGDLGDWGTIGNTTPRYQYSLNLGINYKNFDFNAFIQGVGKRDVLVSNHQRFRGPAQGPFHMMVFEEHLDYFRPEDTTSPLGPNLDAYFPAPYAANPGRNNRNYRFPVDRYIQDGSYVRLKSLQIGFTIPKEVTSKYSITKFRIFLAGENLFTKTDLLFYDPETIPSGFGSAQSYPLSKIISGGINLSF